MAPDRNAAARGGRTSVEVIAVTGGDDGLWQQEEAEVPDWAHGGAGSARPPTPSRSLLAAAHFATAGSFLRGWPIYLLVIFINGQMGMAVHGTVQQGTRVKNYWF